MIKPIPPGTDPKVSVITVSFNQAEFIRDNIESVIAQNYPNFEHHIIDGGSTDGTIDILKSYPHLIWTSEPDRGQAHALNKGFARATGDIIAWVNSDDFYPTGVFRVVAEELRSSAIVMGACENVDKQGKPYELVQNSTRNWFDILKYWIFFSSPAQPSIFFRREILEEFMRDDGSYLDEGLEFCMDWEFWLRCTKKYPLNKRIDKVLSYNRVYENAKTGRDMASAYREMSRAFSRHSNISSHAERKLSILVPFENADEQVKSTVTSALSQDLRDFEIVLVDYNSDNKSAKENRRAVLELEKSQSSATIRYVRSLEHSLLGGVNHGISQTCAPFLACALPGSTIGADLSFEVSNLFRQDIFGMALPNNVTEAAPSLVQKTEQGVSIFSFAGILSTPHIPLSFVARTVAMQELGGFRLGALGPYAYHELLLRMVYKGWQITIQNNLPLVGGDFFNRSICEDLFSKVGEYILAKLVTDLSSEFESDSFAKTRAQHGFALVFPPDIVERTRAILNGAPPKWEETLQVR